MNFEVIKLCVIKCVVRSDCSDVLKIMILSYLFFNLCWDFPYHKLCSDIEEGVLDYLNYDFDFLKGDNYVSKN